MGHQRDMMGQSYLIHFRIGTIGLQYILRQFLNERLKRNTWTIGREYGTIDT